MIKYSTQNVFVRTEKNEKYAYIGISELFSEQLDIVEYIKLPEVGEIFIEDDFIFIDTVSESHEFPSPVSGEIVEVNTELENNPNYINDFREFSDWICKIKLTDKEELDDLLSIDEYRDFMVKQDDRYIGEDNDD